MYRYNNNIGKRDYALFRDISVSSIPEKKTLSMVERKPVVDA